MDKNQILKSLLNTFSIWNETTDILGEMEIDFGGTVGENLNQYIPISIMDTITYVLDGKIEDREEKDPDTGETLQVRYYKFGSDTEYRLDDAVRIMIENIETSESAEECAEKVKTVFV